MLFNTVEIIKSSEKVANLYGGILEIFTSKSGTKLGLKYPCADGIAVDGYRVIEDGSNLKQISRIIKHKNGNITKIKNDLSFLYINSLKGSLKI